MSKTIKLNKTICSTIVRRALQHRFSFGVYELINAQREFSHAFYNDVYNVETRNKMLALPEGWLPSATGIYGRFGTDWDQITFDGRWGLDRDATQCISEKHEKMLKGIPSSFPVLSKHNGYGLVIKAYPGNHKMTDKHRDLVNRRSDQLEQIRSAKKVLEVALGSVSTINRVLENWPDLEPFCKDLVPVTPNLPAVTRTQINAMLDLPVS